MDAVLFLFLCPQSQVNTPMTLFRFVLLQCLMAALLCTQVCAQSDPANFTTVINVPGDTPNTQLNSHTQLNVLPGGVVLFGFDSLDVGQASGPSQNIEVNLLGGEIDARVNAYRNSTLNLNSGVLSDTLATYTGSQVNVAGALVDRISMKQGSNVNLATGRVNYLDVLEGQLVIEGGEVVQLFLYDGSNTTISGGHVSYLRSVESGASLTVTGGVIDDQSFNGFDIESGATAVFHGGGRFFDGC